MKIIGLLCLFLMGCANYDQQVIDLSVLKQHSQPLTIDQIGYWSPGYMILTLVDADNEYFIIKVKQDDRLKRGDNYPYNK